MSSHNYNNDIDNNVDTEIFAGLDFKNPKSFFLFAGAGSGKTRSLVNILGKIKSEYGYTLRVSKQQIAVITYTNAACDELKHRIDYDVLFSVSTIHSFVWELIKNYHNDIREWIKINLTNEISELNDLQQRSRGVNKTSIDRAKKIESKSKRLNRLDEIKRFTYNPNGDNLTKDSLNHSEVINLGAFFLSQKTLMQQILIKKFPILLIDESQDTKKELIDAFFEVQRKHSNLFSLGLFGDTMQRIYSDGKENLGQSLPDDWLKPAKKMNHRCPKRIITLINKIRFDIDKQEQLARTDKEEGIVRFFVVSNKQPDKNQIENNISQKMAEITNDSLWSGDNSDIQTLTLEHHMAARRMGFLELYEPLYKVDRLRTGLLDGTLSGIRFYSQLIIPLIKAKQRGDEFAVARIVRENSPLFDSRVFKESKAQYEIIKTANVGVKSLFSLWKDESGPKLIDVLKNIYQSGLFIIPDSLLIIAKRTDEEQKVAQKPEDSADEEDIEGKNDIIDAWDLALNQSFAQIEAYNEYISGNGKFDTHQGVKGREFPRVMLIIDDEEARGFLFSYEKLFGAKSMSDTDLKNVKDGKETSLDRTLRLFYVACSRAKQSLAIVAYTANPEAVEKTIVQNAWFQKDEIEVIR